MNNKKLIEAMEQLAQSFETIAVIMNSVEVTEAEENAFATAYPFEKSFDELSFDVCEWAEIVISKLQ